MSKLFNFRENTMNLKRISNSIQNFTGFGAFNTIKSQWSGGRVQVQVQVFRLSGLSLQFATDFRRLFSNTIDPNRITCGPGCTPAHERWVRRAIRNTGLSESVSVSLGRNRLGPPKQCNLVWILSPIPY